MDGLDEDLIRVDEDTGAELDGVFGCWGVVGVDGGRAAADIIVAVEDGDVEGGVGRAGVVGEMVGCGGAAGASA